MIEDLFGIMGRVLDEVVLAVAAIVRPENDRSSIHTDNNRDLKDGSVLDENSQRVAGLLIRANDLLAKGDTPTAEACYKYALAEGATLLGLRHLLTRNIISTYSMYLLAAHRNEEHIRFEALFWIADPQSYKVGCVMGTIDPDIQKFIEENSDWLQNWARQLSSGR